MTPALRAKRRARAVITVAAAFVALTALVCVAAIADRRAQTAFAPATAATFEREPANAPARPRNGEPWPAAFRPYGPSSPWNVPLPEHPRLIARSAEMIASAYADGPGTPVLRTSEPGSEDDTHPVYFASATDPLVVLRCTIFCANARAESIRIPAQARPAAGGDHHLGVVQPDGTEYDFWEAEQNDVDAPYGGVVTRDWRDGDVLGYGGGGACSNFFTGSGIAESGGPTAGGACLAAGRIRASELEAGTIAHALFWATRCVADRRFVPPADGAIADDPKNVCLGDPERHIPLGARIWLDLDDAQIAALGLSDVESTYLRALHRYGAFVMDERTCGPRGRCSSEGPLVGFSSLDPPQEAWSFGAEPPGNTYAREHGWRAVTILGGETPRYVLAGPWSPPIDFARHLHIVDPCYAARTCGEETARRASAVPPPAAAR